MSAGSGGTMDIHKPRPWHSFREFLKEYLIIVVGVLTALAAEAGVEALHWRHQVELEVVVDRRRRVFGMGRRDSARRQQRQRDDVD